MVDEVFNIEIKRIEFDVTRNADICTRVWVDDDTIVFFHSDSHYLITRKVGDKLSYRTNSKSFNNVVIPQGFIDMYNSDKDIAKMLKKVHENFRVALNQSKNGAKHELTEYEAFNYIDDEFNERKLFVDRVYDNVQKAEGGFYYYLAKQLGLKKASRDCDPECSIQALGFKMYDGFKKNFKIAKED